MNTKNEAIPEARWKVKGDEDVGNSGSRWWEFYTVRYLLGTAIGTIVLLFLIHHHPDVVQSVLIQMLRKLFPEASLNGYQATILGLSGLAYCYIASAPILFIHAFRHEAVAKGRGILIAISLCVSIGVACWVVGAMPRSGLNSAVLFGMAVIFLLLQILVACFFTIIIVFHPNKSIQFSYYARLALARGNANKAEKEFIESYKHLREHGNALLIVLLEILLAVLLYYSPQELWVYEICFWILPGAFIYFFGQIMEKNFVDFELE